MKEIKLKIYMSQFIPMLLAGVGIMRILGLTFPSTSFTPLREVISGVVMGVIIWVVESKTILALFKQNR